MTGNHSTKQDASIKPQADQTRAPAPDNVVKTAQQMAHVPESVGSTQEMGVRRMIQPKLIVGTADDAYEWKGFS